jgi:hypothetical protein
LIKALIFAASLLMRGGPAPTPDNVSAAMLAGLTFGSGKHVGHCRKAPKGCPARVRLFSGWIVRESLRHGLDPWLLAALIMHESGANPYASGTIGERGLVQIAPGTARKFAGVANWYRDPLHRDACAEIYGACQAPFVEAAAIILRRSLDACGSEDAALMRYGSGRCIEGGGRYARGVRYHRRKLLGAAEGLTQ